MSRRPFGVPVTAPVGKSSSCPIGPTIGCRMARCRNLHQKSPRHVNLSRAGAGPTAPHFRRETPCGSQALPLTTRHAISHPSPPPPTPQIPKMSCLRCRKMSFRVTLDLHLTSLIITSPTSRQRVSLTRSLNMSFLAPAWRSAGNDDTLVKKPLTSDLPRDILENLRYVDFRA